jgi:hypothetical protein
MTSPGKAAAKKDSAAKSEACEAIVAPSSAVPAETDRAMTFRVPAVLRHRPPLPDPLPFGFAALPKKKVKNDEDACTGDEICTSTA